MADIIRLLQEVKAFPEELHWFCPRHGDEMDYFFDEDFANSVQLKSDDPGSAEAREKRISRARTRKTQVLDSMQIFAFDGPDALDHQNWLETHLAIQMCRCDICVREFHRGRWELKQKLESLHDEEDVGAFLERFDEINFKRITKGLESAAKLLRDAPEKRRNLNRLDERSVHAIFEALNCIPFLLREDLLAKYFDEPFGYLWQNKKLVLKNYPPAVAYFLFSPNYQRVAWARYSWTGVTHGVSGPEFQWSVQKPLFNATLRVQLLNLDFEFLPQFWTGVRLIVEKLDEQLITHSLRAMDIDISKLAYEHLQIDNDSFIDLIKTVNHILRESPKAFWEALGTTPPSAWCEQFFNSKALKRILSGVSRTEQDIDSVQALFKWILPFMTSLTPSVQAHTCGLIATELISHSQKSHYPDHLQSFLYNLTLQMLRDALTSLHGAGRNMGGRINLAEISGIISKHISQIVEACKIDDTTGRLCCEILRLTLTLECRCLIFEQEDLTNDRQLASDSFTYSQSIWDQLSQRLESVNIPAAISVALGIRSLVGLDSFISKTESLSAKQLQFNKTFDALNKYIAGYFDSMSNYPSRDLRKLFYQQDSMIAIVSQLFSTYDGVREGTMEVLRSMSDTTDRREALFFLIDANYEGMLKALAFSLRRIASQRTYSPTPSMIKRCDYVVDVLCNSQDGLLRARQLTTNEAKATTGLWEALWHELVIIFRTTEMWSQMGHNKDQMMKFCREAMDFASGLFDQFGVFNGTLGGVLDSPNETKDQKTGKSLVEQPRKAMDAIVKWLKLRDDALLTKSTFLVSNLLVRLKEFEASVASSTLEFIQDMIVGKQRSVLSLQNKAELQRAMEAHSGYDGIFDESESDVKKDRRATNSGTRKPGGNSDGAESEESDYMRKMHSTNLTGLEAYRAQQQLKTTEKKTPKPLLNQAAIQKSMNAEDFRKKREQERLAKKKEDLEAIAAIRRKATGQTAGEGSGLAGLGVQDKIEKGPKGSGMMVSSDEDDSDDDMDKELFGSKKKVKSPNKSRGDHNTVVGRIPQGPVKKQRVQRSTKDMRARLAPDLSWLHKSILSWDYFHDGPFPPNTSANDYNAVLSTFRDPRSYQAVFKPLLILEAWSGFLKAKEENTARPFETKISNRSNVDAFLEISTTVSHADGKDLSEGDIILLSKSKDLNSGPPGPCCLSRIIRVSRKKAHMEVLYRALPATSMADHLSPNAKIFCLKVMSTIPLEREYGAISGLEYYDLCDEITRAKPSPLLNYSDETLQPYMRIYGVNKAQAKAIKSALDNDAFTLVQGPPGSGKTKTIVAIVGALLTNSLRTSGTTTHLLQSQTNGTKQQIQTSPMAKKMLVCAPSNAAVDELVMRFKDGIKTSAGEHKKISVIRIGRSDAINTNVIDVTLDELVNKKLNLQPNKGSSREETQKIMKEHQEVSERLRDTRAKLDTFKGEPPVELKKEFEDLRRSKTLLSSKVDRAKDEENAQIQQADISRRKAQQEVIDEANVICATLSGSGHEMFQKLNVEFETVVIDEAAQCVELSALIPLKYGCAKCILVGDPQQLPPTVFSKDAARFKYEQSLFVRMQANHPKDVHLLDTQYRMHPQISDFPSSAFYDGRLLDGPEMAKLRARSWHAAELLGPYRFFDVQGQHQAAPRGHSLVNYAEIRVAMRLYNRLTTDFRSYDFKGKVGIITPYKSQLKELKEQFKRNFHSGITDDIEFNTTDAFQGRESEVIIFSCVRASPAGGIGFLQDIRRMNVGLTRAKSSLWVLGNSQSLMKGEYWAKLVEHSQKTRQYTTGDLEAILDKRSNMVGKIDVVVEDKQPNANGLDNKGNVAQKERVLKPPSSRVIKEVEKKTLPAEPKPTETLKRKRSPSEDTSMGSGSSSSPSSGSSDDDVVMADAPQHKTDSASSQPKPKFTTPQPATKPQAADKKPAEAPTKVEQKAPLPPPPVRNKPPLPAHLRKKKPVDVFNRNPPKRR